MNAQDRSDTVAAAARPFFCRKFLQDDEVFGARWWHEGFVEVNTSNQMGRRSAVKALLVLGGAASLLAVMPVVFRSCDDEKTISIEALELQRKQGWDVGEQGAALTLSGAVPEDVAGTTDWRHTVRSLAHLMEPQQPALVRYYVPTLLQAPALPSNASLAGRLQPVRTARMDQAYVAAESLLAQFEALSAFPTDTALILDMPGPVSVAAAAALAARFDPVSLLDNWPHPRGVVPSQDSLGAVLFFAPKFQRLAEQRARPAPPAFILDSDRLRTPASWDNVFDNRFMAKLPPVDGFRELGIKHVLYVVESAPASGRPAELDDLNDDFVALTKSGIDVKILALSDLQRVVELYAASATDSTAATRNGSTSTSQTHVHSPVGFWFWSSYGWHSVPAPQPAGAPARVPAAPMPSGAGYTPAPRPTMFSTRTVGGLGGVGKQRPAGFGLVSARSDSSGRVGPWTGGSRSGSWGRSRSSSSG